MFFDIKTEGDTLVSIALVASAGPEFYADFTESDYSGNELLLKGLHPMTEKIGNLRFVKGDKDTIIKNLHKWLNQFRLINFWGDTPQTHNILMDLLKDFSFDEIEVGFFYISEMFRLHGFDEDIDREAFVDVPAEGVRFSTLYNARTLEGCYDKFYRNKEKYDERNKKLVK